MQRPFFFIIGFQIVGFALVILAVWADEVFDLANVLFDQPKVPFNLVEAISESTLLLFLGGSIVWVTFRLLSRIRYLEGFFVICSFCKKVRIEERWIPLEEFLQKKSDIALSHSFCEDCVKSNYPNISE